MDTTHNKRGQAWSTDLMLAMVAFGIIAVIFYAVVANDNAEDINELQTDAEYLSTLVKTGGDTQLNSLIRNNQIDETRIQEILKEMAGRINDEEDAKEFYAELKGKLNIQSDFCIYIEDEHGRLDTETLHWVPQRHSDPPETCFGGIGDPDFYIFRDPSAMGNDIVCGMPIPC